jgi:hypothetical protein
VIGGAVVDSSLGAGAIPFAAAVIPLAALVFILTQERGHGVQTRIATIQQSSNHAPDGAKPRETSDVCL